jgi:hypothetical protein
MRHGRGCSTLSHRQARHANETHAAGKRRAYRTLPLPDSGVSDHGDEGRCVTVATRRALPAGQSGREDPPPRALQPDAVVSHSPP